MEKTINNQSIRKTMVFYGNKYIINHDFVLTNAPENIFVYWDDGIKTTEKNLYEELTFSSAYVAQSKEINSLSFSPQ